MRKIFVYKNKKLILTGRLYYFDHVKIIWDTKNKIIPINLIEIGILNGGSYGKIRKYEWYLD